MILIKPGCDCHNCTNERDDAIAALSGAQNAIDDMHRLLDLEPSDDPSDRAFMVRCAVENMREKIAGGVK